MIRGATVSTIAFASFAILVAGCKQDGEGESTTTPTDDTAAEDFDAAATETESEGPEPIRVADVGFDTPESVAHDAEADVYLVSNIVGSPLEKDGEAFISRVSPEGEVSELKWIDGAAEGVTLNAPKGMAIAGDMLYVTDIDVVRVFDRASGEPQGAIPVEGSTFLNDLAASEDTLYLTDSGMEGGEEGLSPSGTDAVYTIPAGDTGAAPEALIEGPDQLKGPNGIAAADEGAWVVTFRAKEFYRVSPDGSKGEVTELPKGGLDGLIALDDGSVLVSSWEGQAVYQGEPGGEFEEVISDVSAPADIGYDAERGRVLVPLFEDSAVLIHPLES